MSDAKREGLRSFILGVVNGTVWRFAESLIDASLVLTWFVSRLTSSNVLIGLVAPVSNAGYLLPQIFVSTRVQRMRLKMPMYTVGAVVRIVVWVLLSAVVWLVDDRLSLLIGFFILFTISRTAAGLSGLSFFDVIAKTIPARRRGMFFAWRQLLGGVFGLLGGWIVRIILNSPVLAFPHGHALLFFLYCLLMVVSTSAFIAIREPPGLALDYPVTFHEQLLRAGKLLRQDRVYRSYIAVQVTLALAGMSGPFFGIYVKRVLQAPDGMVGVYVAVRAAALLLFNLPWGHLSDRRGNRLVLRLMILGNILTILLALALMALVAGLHLAGAWLPYLAIPVFLLSGAVIPAQMLAGTNFLLELIPEAERPLYIGLSNTLIGVTLLLSGVGGVLVDILGFAGLLAVSLGLCLAGYGLATGLPEPRSPRGQRPATTVQ